MPNPEDSILREAEQSAGSNDQTFWCHHYVPSGVTCYVLSCYGGATAVGGGITLNHSGNLALTNLPQGNLAGTYVHPAAGAVDHSFRVPIAIPGPDLVWAVERPIAATASTAYATLEYVQG
jgi:hypothetical protein